MAEKKRKDIVSDERRTQDLQSVSRTLLPLAKRLLGAKGMMEVDLLAGWEDIAGTEIAAYTLPLGVSFRRGEKTNGILQVEVPAGAFALELKHRENFILAKVNAYFGYRAVAGMKIIQTGTLQPKEDDNIQAVQKSLVTEEEENYIRNLSMDVENEELQQMLEKLGRSVISNNKGKK